MIVILENLKQESKFNFVDLFIKMNSGQKCINKDAKKQNSSSRKKSIDEITPGKYILHLLL